MPKSYGDAVTLALMQPRQAALFGRKPMTLKRKAQQGKFHGRFARPALISVAGGAIELSWKWVMIAAMKRQIDGAPQNKS